MGALYVVATPIGNLADITFRAISILHDVDYIFCEDTRVTRKLLSHYTIRTPCIAYHAASGGRVIERARQLLKTGKNIALVSDAGTPAISDPGVKFVREMRRQLPQVSVHTVPGASAVTAALAISGAPASAFVFLGFPPQKKGRVAFFTSVAAEERTVVLYESPHRLLKTLALLRDVLLQEREVIVLRELTKVYESIVSGSIETVLAHFIEHPDEVRGECVIVISQLFIEGA